MCVISLEVNLLAVSQIESLLDDTRHVTPGYNLLLCAPVIQQKPVFDPDPSLSLVLMLHEFLLLCISTASTTDFSDGEFVNYYVLEHNSM